MAERHLRLVAATQAVREAEERVGYLAEKRAGREAEPRVGYTAGKRAGLEADRKEARQPTAIDFAIAVVSSRSLPEKKLRERLATRYGADEVDATMDRMRELRLVDDAAWAERYARDRFERLGKGRHRIRNELVSHGIAAAMADASIASVLGGPLGSDIERDKAVAVLETMRFKLARGAAGNEDRVRIRLFRRMLARGYPASLVRDLLDVS